MLGSAYFLEGLGYIVTATFIVTIVATTAGLEPFAPYTWVAVGLAAVPSTIIWPLLARRFGIRRALLAAYTLQAAGIGVSACSTSLAGVMFAAVSFGATFLGIVAMVLSEGKARMGAHAGQAAAFLAAGTVMGGALLLVLDSHFITSEKKKG
jgi:MFS family permease